MEEVEPDPVDGYQWGRTTSVSGERFWVLNRIGDPGNFDWRHPDLSALGTDHAEAVYALQRFLDALSAKQLGDLAAYFQVHTPSPRVYVRLHPTTNDPEHPGKISRRYWAHGSMYSAIKAVLISSAPEEALDEYSVHVMNVDLGDPGWLALQDVLLDVVDVFSIPEMLTRPQRQLYLQRWNSALEVVGIKA